MHEPGKELDIVVPSRLRSLASEAPIDSMSALAISTKPYLLEPYGLLPIGPTARKRLIRLARKEVENLQSGYIVPRWMDVSEPIPRLIVSIRYSRRDVHGVQVRLRDLDIAARRAASTLENWLGGESRSEWSYPMRPERGGLWVLDARRGSVEVFATVYGALVTVATSTPVALVALMSLAYDAKVAIGRAGRWTVRQFQSQASGAPPALGAPADGQTWRIETTKALEPIMKAAIDAGVGFEFVNSSDAGEIRLAVPPRSELISDDK